MKRWMLVAGSVLGATGVMAGAFGAHAIQGVLEPRAMGWYDTAVTYHAGHALALIACALLSNQFSLSRWITAAAIAFLTGVVVFSGSLYLMAFSGWTPLGMITPIGGAALIVGWFCLCPAAFGLQRSP